MSKPWWLVLVLAIGCGSKDSAPAPAPPAAPPVVVAPEPPAAAAFAKERWARTKMYDGKPYIGWTYVDPNKGPCMKGEVVAGLAPAKIKELLHAKFPSSSLEPLEDGQVVTPLTDAEVKDFELPAQPDWYAEYKKMGGAI